jgi:2-polyprenyl-3-methyl-5-hydroxy-6-metoxy-1,4-benzoquinol methylase/8-oxo-dGTP pyrophosphatase MutT (NUDIX family)
VVRPSAYAVIRNTDGALAIVRTPRGCFLPGGGLITDETPEETITRETREECGLVVEPGSRIGKAVEIVHSPAQNTCFEKPSVFMSAELLFAGPSSEPDHELIWLDPAVAIAVLSHESHRWAVRQFIPALWEDNSTRSWNSIADDWVKHADTNDYRNHFLMPRMFQMLDDIRGRRVLDLGCGEGGYSRELARRGAQVTGIDGSSRLIEVARERSIAETLDIHYECTNANALDNIVAASFDIVVASMSLMDVEDYAGSIREVHRVLVPGGELVMSITHPCFSAPVAEWIHDATGTPRAFSVDRYFERTVWDSLIARTFSAPVLRRHRPLEDFMNEPLQAGFELREFREPSATADDLRKSIRFTHLTRIPYFLFLRWKKPL